MMASEDEFMGLVVTGFIVWGAVFVLYQILQVYSIVNIALFLGLTVAVAVGAPLTGWLFWRGLEVIFPYDE